MWEQRSEDLYQSFTHAVTVAVTVAVDASGNVLVAGDSTHQYCPPRGPRPCHSFDVYYTAKYAAADGSLLWRHSYDEGGAAMQVDAFGNMVVSGTFGGYYYTAKYAASNGTALWEKRHNGSTGDALIGSSRALALGPDGSIVVTGTSSGDYVTVKYIIIPVPDRTPVVLSLALTSEGARVRFTGDAGRTYRFQRASDPSGPWTTFATLTAPPNGAVEHLDPAPLASLAFYRVAAP